VSQSPEAASAAADRIDLYQEGWRALGRMIAEGRSFSGYERNCCFLNIGDGQFADISSSSELDFLDDSRAVAVVDWDFDGRVDFWVTNRTAPRIRYLRNDTRNDCHFVALRLEGVTCNHDAIGARVELYRSGSSDRVSVKQLSAGDGYLSQSSKWLHFGISAGVKIDRLVVHWPGGGKETFRDIDLDQHYRLVQGSGAAKPWAPPREERNRLLPDVAPPPVDPLRRTVIVGRVPLPHAEYLDWHDNLVPLTQYLGKPLLVNLWSPSCMPCLNELSAWTKDADRLRAAEFNVLALCVDSLLQPDQTQGVHAKQTLDKIGFPWPAGAAQHELVQTLELMHHTYLELKQDLRLPSSFLLDSHGRLAVIYKGPIPTSVLLADIAALDEDAGTRRASAVPFPGRWASKPFVSDPEPIVRNLDKLGRTADAIEYAHHCIAGRNASTDALGEASEPLIDLYAVLGELLLKHGQRKEAGLAFDRALELGDNGAAIHGDVGQYYMSHNMPAEALRHLAAALVGEPHDAELLYNLGLAELATRQPANAIAHLRRSYDLMPDDANACFQLANALHATGQTQDALIHYRRALQLRPGWPFATNNLAWILATHRDASIRNGPESVRLAEALCQDDGRSDPSWLATLAAAYAEAGRFDDAVRTNERAAELAESKGQMPVATRLRGRTAVFRNGRPVRE
jgi:tetratricopeptide (TPR) repeat protein